MSSSATGVGMPICFLGAILLILTQKSSQKFGDVLGIFYLFPKYKRLVYDSYLRKIGICVSGLQVVSYLCSICAFRGHNSALS